MAENKKKYLTIQEVAQQLGVHETTIYRLANHGKLPAFKIGSQWRFDSGLLDNWVKEQAGETLANSNEEGKGSRGRSQSKPGPGPKSTKSTGV